MIFPHRNSHILSNYRMDIDPRFRSTGKIVPHNSLSDILNEKSGEQRNAVGDKDSTTGSCQQCEIFSKNLLHLESYLRNSVIHDPCSSCSTCLSFIQYMKQALKVRETKDETKASKPLSTPILNEYYVVEAPQDYINQQRMQMFPDFMERMMTKRPFNLPPRRAPTRRMPRVVEFPIPTQTPSRLPARSRYSTRTKVRKPTESLRDKKLPAKKKVANPKQPSPAEVPPVPKKAKKKKRTKAAGVATAGNLRKPAPVAVK